MQAQDIVNKLKFLNIYDSKRLPTKNNKSDVFQSQIYNKIQFINTSIIAWNWKPLSNCIFCSMSRTILRCFVEEKIKFTLMSLTFRHLRNIEYRYCGRFGYIE